MGKEFLNIKGSVKNKLIRVTGNVDILNNYLNDVEKTKNLDLKDIKHLKSRIEMMEMYNAIEQENIKKLNDREPLIAPVEREDGTIELINIHQDNVQNTFNGCWSVSLQLLLQSRGVNLTQEQIRWFRSDILTEKEANDLREEETVNQDKKATLDKKTDLVMKVLPNTSLNMTQISRDGGATVKEAVEKFKEVVTMALKDDCSPVSMVRNGHFRTIVGIKGDEVLLKDSIQYRTKGPNHTYSVKIEDLVKTRGKSVGLYWLHDMHLEKDGSCAEFEGNSALAYKEGNVDFKPLAKEPPSGAKYRDRPLTAIEFPVENWVKNALAVQIETYKFNSLSGGFGTYIMNLPKQIHPAEPRKIRKFSEAEIGLFDKLKEREVLEDLQMKLNTVDETGFYPALTEENLKELDKAYETVSKMYESILADESFIITEKQKKHFQALKENTDRERQIISNIKINENSVMPTYRDAIHMGKIEIMQANEKAQFVNKEKALQNFNTKFDNIKKEGHKNSKEYIEMLKSMERVRRIMDCAANPEKWEELKINPAPNEKKLQELVEQYEKEATQAVDKYIKAKGNPYTEFGKQRLAEAKALKAEMQNSVTAFLKEKSDLKHEMEKDKSLKETLRMKAELSKNPPFPSDELKALRDKLKIETPMSNAGNKSILALERLGSMKYLKDNKAVEPDKNRVHENLAKILAFTLLGGRKFNDPATENEFSEKYFNTIVTSIQDSKILDRYSIDQWFDILEKKEGAPSLQQICGELDEVKLLLKDTLKAREIQEKKVENSVKNQYLIYSPTKIDFKQHNSEGISKYVKAMNSVKDAQYDLKVSEDLGLNNRELALLTTLQIATLEVGQHYKGKNLAGSQSKMLNAVAFLVNNTVIERENDENNLGRLNDKGRQALSTVLKELESGNMEPMHKLLKEALPNFRTALINEHGWSTVTRTMVEIGANVYEMLQNHKEFVPETLDAEVLQTYKGMKECSEILKEGNKARKDLAEIDYNNLEDPSVKSKLEDALIKIALEDVIEKVMMDDYAVQLKDIEEKTEEAANAIMEKISKIPEMYPGTGREVDIKRTQAGQILSQEFNAVGTTKRLELLRPPKILTEMNPDTRKELTNRIKSSQAFKNGMNNLYTKQNVKELFLMNHEKTVKQFTTSIVTKNINLVKDLSGSEKTMKAESTPSTEKDATVVNMA